jgi:hypothetical protein
MTVDPGQMVPQFPRGGVSAESMVSWEAFRRRSKPVELDRPVETPAFAAVPLPPAAGAEPPVCVGDLVDVGMAQFVVVVGPDGRLVLDGPVNRRADCGGLW